MRALIRIYQLTVSPILTSLGCQCRYHPSCSEYARQNFAELPFHRAMWNSIKRVLSCH